MTLRRQGAPTAGAGCLPPPIAASREWRPGPGGPRANRALPLLFSLFLLACTHPESPAQDNYTLTQVVSGLSLPARMAFAPDGSGRLFCLELKTGYVRIVVNDTLMAEPWAHFNVAQEQERGLLGIAFDSGFASNHLVYLYYTAAETPVVNRVVRVAEAGGRADSSSVVTIYEAPVATPCGTFGNHNAGGLVVDAAGTLFISTGEDNCPTLSQSLQDPRGKILRIDPALPLGANAVASNPFYDDGDPSTGNDDRIYATGLRNPYGMTLSPLDGFLYVTENGPDCNDEVDRITAGRNCGWRPECNTGPAHCQCSQDSPYARPLWRITPTIAPTGLIVYDGQIYPGLSGRLIFLSYNDARVRAGTFIDGGDSLDVSVAAQPGLGSLYDIVAGPDGYLYVSNSSAVFRVNPLQTGVSAGPERSGGDRLSIFPPAPGGEGSFTLEYLLATGSEVSLRLYDIVGRCIAEPVTGYRGPGIHRSSLDPRGFPSGVYFARLSAGTTLLQEKFIVTR